MTRSGHWGAKEYGGRFGYRCYFFFRFTKATLNSTSFDEQFDNFGIASPFSGLQGR